MKIVAIADIQNQCLRITPKMLPEGDMLVIAGDLTNYGDLEDLLTFNRWLGGLPYQHRLVIAGNHDLGLAREFDGHDILDNATYLEDEQVEIGGIKFYGTPANNCGPFAPWWEFCNTSFVRRSAEAIPYDTDVLIAHGPIYGVLDRTLKGELTGSKEMQQAVHRLNLRAMIFGHIHESRGFETQMGTLFVNAAVCDPWNNLKIMHGQEPIVIDTQTWSVVGQTSSALH